MYGYESVQLTGGEALTRKDIFGIIDSAIEIGLKLDIQTNGVIDDDTLLKLLAYPPERLSFIISIDGIAANDKFRGQGITKKVMDISGRLSERFDIRINTLLSSYIDDSEIDTIINFSKMINATIALNPVCPVGRGNRVDIMPAERYFHTMERLEGITNLRKGYTLNGDKSHLLETEDCPVRKGRAVFISSNGDVYPCGFLEGVESFNMGNIVTVDYDFIPLFDNYPSEVKIVADTCKACEKYKQHFCHAGCPARIAALNNQNLSQVEYYCMKNYYERDR